MNKNRDEATKVAAANTAAPNTAPPEQVQAEQLHQAIQEAQDFRAELREVEPERMPQALEDDLRRVFREEIDAALDARGLVAIKARDTDKDPFGPLNAEGAHQIAGKPAENWYFTLTGWDRAKTDLQRANLRTQLGLDIDGVENPAGPGPVGWETGQVVNPFLYPLFRDGGPDGLGGRLWRPADASPHWQYHRLRVRARGAKEILASLREFENAKPGD